MNLIDKVFYHTLTHQKNFSLIINILLNNSYPLNFFLLY